MVTGLFIATCFTPQKEALLDLRKDLRIKDGLFTSKDCPFGPAWMSAQKLSSSCHLGKFNCEAESGKECTFYFAAQPQVLTRATSNVLLHRSFSQTMASKKERWETLAKHDK